MKRVIRGVAVLAGMVLATQPAFAQRIVRPAVPAAQQAKDEIGKPVLKHEVTSGKEFANILRNGCLLKDSYISCEQILGMFRESPNLQRYDINSMEKLMNYLEYTWDVVPCTPGKSATMYRVLVDVNTKATRVIADWNRACRSIGGKAELWMIDRETGQIIVSLWCGNVIASADEGAVQTKYFEVPKKVEPVFVREKFRTSITVFDSAIVTVANRSVTVRKDTVLMYPDSSEISIRVSRSAPKAPVVIVHKPGGTSKKKILAGALVGGALGYLGGYYTGQQNVTCQLPTRGGPVNPPNNMTPTGGLSIRW